MCTSYAHQHVTIGYMSVFVLSMSLHIHIRNIKERRSNKKGCKQELYKENTRKGIVMGGAAHLPYFSHTRT